MSGNKRRHVARALNTIFGDAFWIWYPAGLCVLYGIMAATGNTSAVVAQFAIIGVSIVVGGLIVRSRAKWRLRNETTTLRIGNEAWRLAAELSNRRAEAFHDRNVSLERQLDELERELAAARG